MSFVKAVNYIVSVTIGSVWRIPNKKWTNRFARNKPGDDFHPGLVSKMRKDGITVSLIPGTTKDYKKGSCVFKTKLTPWSRQSYFLLEYSMPFLIEELEQLPAGWNNVQRLTDLQIRELKLQLGFCKGVSIVD